MGDDIIPLPERLNDCGCPSARAGAHLTSCRPAREHEMIPLQQKEGYALGQRFQAVNWVYPLTFHAEISVTVDVDPLQYIAAHRDQYDAFEPSSGHEEWEKPVAFLAHLLAEDLDLNGALLTRFSGGRWMSRESAYVDEIRESPSWTPLRTEELLTRLPTPVDPNQGVLLAAVGPAQ